jgi:molybdopterin synthase catalytic subunit
MPFEITPEPIDPVLRMRGLAAATAGACVTFEGWVRDHNDGAPVLALEYEAHEAIATREGEKILVEARERFAIVAADCVHRVGKLAIGDCAVWVGVAAAHRGAAFDACRYIIDETKSRVPIWKKEHYASGTSGWVNCATQMPR